MKSNTSDAKSEGLTHHKKNRWEYPLSRPWIEFVVIIILLFMCMLSMIGLAVDANESKIARAVAISRLEVIYNDLMRSENNLRLLNSTSIKEDQEFHKQVNESMKTRNELLKKIAAQVCVPESEINGTLKKDPTH